MTPDGDHGAVLACPMRPNDADAATFGEYLVVILATLWKEAEGFSGKRPLGNSDWQWRAYESLADAGLIEATFDADGYLDEFDPLEADALILPAIRSISSHIGGGDDAG